MIEPVSAHDFTEKAARDAYPHGGDVARLIALASDVEPDARAMIFQEGLLETVTCVSEDEWSIGESAYSVYMSIRSNGDAIIELPDPAAYLGIHVPRSQFEAWQDDGLVLDREAWEAEIRRRCVVEFVALIAEWRGNFLLLSRPAKPVRRQGE